MNSPRLRVCVFAAFAVAGSSALAPAARIRPAPAVLSAAGTREAPAAVRSSANYSLAAEIADGGGQPGTSLSYTQSGSIGAVSGVSSVTAPAETAKAGYLGQLYDIVGFTLNAPRLSVAEHATLPLGGGQLLDDDTTLAVPASAVTWSVASGPLASIDANGLASAGTVYDHTAAVARGDYNGRTGTLMLTVLNVNIDDYDAYAGDGIDDSWQVRYFGVPPNALAGPGADADGTGQSNLFKYLAGLDPLDPLSRFVLTIDAVPGHPDRKNLSFRPIFGGRTYFLQASDDPGAGTWTAIDAPAPDDHGDTRTITDLGAAGARKFYRVRITKP